MSTDKPIRTRTNNRASLSLDPWAVIAALLLALAVRFDILNVCAGTFATCPNRACVHSS
jgi:hypothetical protein